MHVTVEELRKVIRSIELCVDSVGSGTDPQKALAWIKKHCRAALTANPEKG